MIKQLVDDTDREKEALQQQLDDKVREVETTKKMSAIDDDVQKSFLQKMADQMQLLKDADSYVTKQLKGTFSAELEMKLQESQQYCVRTPGMVDEKLLKKCGLKLKGSVISYDQNDNMINNELDQWVDNWQCSITGEELRYELPPSYPPFEQRAVFRSREGKFVSVREEDEITPGKSIHLGGRNITLPDTVYSAAFVKYVRSQFGKADAIFRHLMQCCNELQECESASGYSVPRILWDTEAEAPMKPEDKTKLLMELNGKRLLSKVQGAGRP